MNVLVACEYSGRVRDAFVKQGHFALSCDLLPTESPGEYYQGDVLDIIDAGWDLMIAHPPCTFLCNSGERWLKDNVERQRLRIAAVRFVKRLYDSNISRIAIENPIGHLSTAWRKPDQILQPWQFGHGETKATCLWLKNLPILSATNIVAGRVGRLHRLPPSADRSKMRSLTYQGIADAMGNQWGQL